MSKYYFIVLGVIFVISGSYIAQFYFFLNFPISESPEHWGQLGDYLGGLINPFLSFISIVLLIKSLTEQYEVNKSLILDIKNKEKVENIRMFEGLFFQLIQEQKILFSSLKIKFPIKIDLYSGRIFDSEVYEGVHAVNILEANISSVNIQELDYHNDDILYEMLRIFSQSIKLVDDKLGDDNKFCQEEREGYFKFLITSTHTAQLRLFIICLQFYEDCHPVDYIRAHPTFSNILRDLGVTWRY